MKRFASFAGVGGIATGIQYALLFVLVEFFGTSVPLSSAIGFIVSACFNYIANFYITFNCQRKHTEALPRFLTVSAVGLLLNTVMVYILVEKTSINYMIAQILSTSAVLLWNYEANRRWTYQNVDSRQQGARR